MAWFRHTAEGAVRTKVGKGSAVTEYKIPISKPADVVNRSVDADTLKKMSDTLEEQGVKMAVGLLTTIVTWFLVSFLAMNAYDKGFRLSMDIVFGTYLFTLIVIGIVAVNQYANRDESSFEQIVWIASAVAIVLMLRSIVRGTEEQTVMLILAFWISALNPLGLGKLVAGMRGWNDVQVARKVLYVNEQVIHTTDYVPPSRAEQLGVQNETDAPILDGVRSNGKLIFPAVGGVPFLVRQVEDFCYIAMQETSTGKGKGSGLARSVMLNQMIGPRNSTVPGRPQSYIKVTRDVYDAIMAGLYALDLVETGAGGAAVWSKIKEGTEFACGYSIHEIRTMLLSSSNEGIK